MKYRFIIIIALLLSVQMLSAKGKGGKEVYMFGFASSFTDSVVYVTSVQHLSDVEMSGTKVLKYRSEYSEQLRYYLNNNALTDRLIVVFFHTDKKKVEKRMQKLERRYRIKRGYEWKTIDAGSFSFETHRPDQTDKQG